MSLLACGGMLACTNEDVTGENDGKEGTTSYMAVNIMTASGPGSRALPTGYEEGSDEENAISKMRFYLFDSDGNPYTLTGETNCVEPEDTYTEDTNDKENETVEEVGNAVLVINGSTATPPASVVAILNYDPNGGEDAFAKKNLTQLKAAVGNYGAASSGNFIMSNSVYNDATTIGEVSIDGKLTNDADEAKNNPVDIYVERVVAKVSVTFSGADKEGNQYLVSGTDGTEDAIYAKVTGWQVADYKNQSYILKNINKDWTDTNLGITPTWSSTDYHRSFWATSATGSVVNDKSWSEITNLTNPVYTQENTPSAALTGVSIDNNDLTKVIVAVQLVDKNGTAKPRYQYLGVPYENEAAILNSIAAKFQSYYIKTDASAYRPIKEAELKFVKGSTVEGASYRVYAQLADEFTAAMTGEKTNLYTKSSESSYQKVDDLTTLNNNLKKYYAQVWNDGMAYYYTTIKHLGNSGKVGEYGVVRNHVYKVTITDIKGFGTPVYDPSEDIDPVKPADDTSYLAAKINILSWHVVSKDVTLGE